MKKKIEALSLPELRKQRDELIFKIKLGKSKNTGELGKIRKEIARSLTLKMKITNEPEQSQKSYL
jgi:ribosomal protein L29